MLEIFNGSILSLFFLVDKVEFETICNWFGAGLEFNMTTYIILNGVLWLFILFGLYISYIIFRRLIKWF